MNEPFYKSTSTVTIIKGVHRRATLESGPLVDFGVHGAVKNYYKLHDAEDMPLPVDYIVAATGA